VKAALSILVAAAALLTSLVSMPAGAETLRERFIDKLRQTTEAAPPINPGFYVFGATRLSARYGPSPEQTLDVYCPPNAHDAPIIVMVHGGAWAIGDKNSKSVVINKLRHWLPKGFILVSIDYRLLPEAMPDVQANDVAVALAYVERSAPAWGGDFSRLILMGHSAGAHLVALLSAYPALVTAAGGWPWSGTVVLDSAALDVNDVMSHPHPRLYDDAFGRDPSYWASVSPTASLSPEAVPMLLVCSLLRPDHPCVAARAFAAAVGKATGKAPPVLPEPLTHGGIDNDLGLPGLYTLAVDHFIASRISE
jgi:acetyl esterase/lipase